jgi:hypothetical protein
MINIQKRRLTKTFLFLTILTAICFGSRLSTLAQFSVTASGFSAFVINGTNNVTLTLERGVTYVFNFSGTSIHPFWIKSSLGFGSTGAFNTGVVNNGSTSSPLSFTVPENAPNLLHYQCGNHGGMTGDLNIITPATPPTVRIVHIDVAQFITIHSTGADGWNAIPEFKCDATTPGWSPVATFTNTFASGTNMTTFPRLDPICGSSNVLIRVRNQPN